MEINTYPSTSLRNILPRKPAAELRTLAKAYYVKGCSKMNKHDLAEAVCAELQVPERMEELLYVIDDPIWRMFQQAAAFGKRFGRSLDASQRRVLHEFLSLPGKTVPGRLKSIMKYRFTKSSWLQTLAQCVTIPKEY